MNKKMKAPKVDKKLKGSIMKEMDKRQKEAKAKSC